MNQTSDWKSEFDRRTNAENYTVGNNHKLDAGDYLLDPEWYPESAYELDPERIKVFIEKTIETEKRKWSRDLLEKVANEMEKTGYKGVAEALKQHKED